MRIAWMTLHACDMRLMRSNMDMNGAMRIVEGAIGAGMAWWDSASPWPFRIWVTLGALFFLAAIAAGYWLVRRGLGHHRINGVWIRPDELEAVLDRLAQRERDGGSMSVADFKLLDRFRPRRHDRLQKMGDKDYVTW